MKLVTCTVIATTTGSAHAQTSKRPFRAVPPTFRNSDSERIYFADLETVLKGEVPWRLIAGQNPQEQKNGDRQVESNDTPNWSALISAESLEDLIKESKQRLDRAITTPSSFAGGGYQKAGVEFSLLSLLFAIVEVYPEEVRWKASAATLKFVMNRVASNTKAGTRQVFDEAKRRKSDLEAVLNGETIEAEPNTEVGWEHLINIGPLMQIIGSAYEQHITPGVANEAEFSKRIDELTRNCELIAVLATTATIHEMPNADDDQFRALADKLRLSARMLLEAVEKRDAVVARSASGQMGQSCQQCHDNYR